MLYSKCFKNDLWIYTFHIFFLVDEDGMDCLDNERRPHFPQFSYSASGREWTVHHSDIITAGLWGHHCGRKETHSFGPTQNNHDLKDFCPFPLPRYLFFTSPVCFFSLSLFFKILSNPSLEKTFRRNYGLILHCNPRWSELWCDQLLCNDPLMMGAPPVACCALTCVGPAKL